MTVEEWLADLTLPYKSEPEGPEGKIEGAMVVVEHGLGAAVTINVHDSDDYRVNITPYLTGACRIIEQETGKIPMQFLSRFDNGIEIVVIPHPEEVAGADYH